MLNDILKLYDKIYRDFPEAYNDAEGKFGRITSVKIYEEGKNSENPQKYLRKQPCSYFYRTPVKYQYGDGFVMPLVYALSAIMTFDEKKVSWKTDPYNFLEKNLSTIVKNYKGVLSMSDWDSSKVGKNSASYSFAKLAFNDCIR